MKRAILNRHRPILCGIMAGQTPEQLIAGAKDLQADGADAIAIELFDYQIEYRNVESFKRIINSVDLPFMFCYYRTDRLDKPSDEQRQSILLQTVEAGAAIVDVMADLYDPSPRQISYHTAAVARQMELINKIHSMGAQVVMSAHTQSFLNFDETLAMLQAMEQRGADIVKIVNTANTPDELAETMRTTMLLKEKLNKPFIHLCSGKYRHPHRFIGSMLGASLVFGVHSYNNAYTFPQPLLRSLRQCMESMNWSVYDLN